MACGVGLAGLEAVVGFPEFASAKKVLEAMWREHTEGEHALVKFTAWNHGEARETTCGCPTCLLYTPPSALFVL